MNDHLILAINPGSTSTKIAIYNNTKCIFSQNIKHSPEELAKFDKIAEQFEFRKAVILKVINNSEIDLNDIKIIVGRGGLVKPIRSGVYEVNARMKEDLKIGILGQHASNLGGLIADDIAKNISGSRAFIADPVVVDELEEVARISGHPDFQRISIFHALNQKAVARTYAKSISKDYKDLNLIVVHLGGGISIGAHKKGRVIDVNQALDGEGPFSPERSGTLPVGELVKMCFSGKYTLDEAQKIITGKGGFVAYLNTNDAYEVEKRVDAGDPKATLIHQAMAYQVTKEIGASYAVLDCNVDAIILTGGIAYDKKFVDYIKQKIEKIAPLIIYPGEDEMKSLAENGLMVLTGEVTPLIYE